MVAAVKAKPAPTKTKQILFEVQLKIYAGEHQFATQSQQQIENYMPRQFAENQSKQFLISKTTKISQITT